MIIRCWILGHHWIEVKRERIKVFNRDKWWLRIDTVIEKICSRCGFEMVDTQSIGEFRNWDSYFKGIKK